MCVLTLFDLISSRSQSGITDVDDIMHFVIEQERANASNALLSSIAILRVKRGGSRIRRWIFPFSISWCTPSGFSGKIPAFRLLLPMSIAICMRFTGFVFVFC